MYLPFLPLLYNTHSKGPRLCAGALCVRERECLQNVQEEDTIRPCFCRIINLYPEDRRIVSPISPSPLQHTQQRAPALCRGPLCLGERMFTKRSRGGHDSAMIFRYAEPVPERQNSISHFSLFFTTHTAESPGPVPGLFVENWPGNSQKIHVKDMIRPCFSGMLIPYPEDNIISPISLSFTTHRQGPRHRAGAPACFIRRGPPRRFPAPGGSSSACGRRRRPAFLPAGRRPPPQ